MKPVRPEILLDSHPDAQEAVETFLHGKAGAVVLRGEPGYLKRKPGSQIALQVGLGILTTAGIFLLLPITQKIASLGRDRSQIVQVEVEISPPPPPDLELDPPEPPPPPPPPPDMDVPPPRVSLDAIDASLNLGTGDATAGVAVFEGFAQTSEDTAADLAIFDIKDLDSAPRLIRPGTFVYPPQLKRARVAGSVTLSVIIDERGGVTVQSVKEARIREFVKFASDFATTSVFDTPKKNGQPVRARYDWTINFAP